MSARQLQDRFEQAAQTLPAPGTANLDEIRGRARGRRRRRHAWMAAAAMSLVVLAGIAGADLLATGPGGPVIEPVTHGGQGTVELADDAIWKSPPTADATEAVRNFVDVFLGWDDPTIELGTDDETGPVWVSITASGDERRKVEALFTPTPAAGVWQVVQVGDGLGTVGGDPVLHLGGPVPSDTASADLYIRYARQTWHVTLDVDQVRGREVDLREHGLPPGGFLGSGLVVYRDRTGESLTAAGGHYGTADEPSPPSPTTEGNASQTPTEAARDGVLPGVAALGFDQRVEISGPYGPGQTNRVETEEGVWVVSRMPRETRNLTTDGSCGLGATDDPNAVYRRDVICTSEYGEILLLDQDGQRILRAFPLPGVPPTRVAVTDEAVWCARVGDGGLPDSMLCRIDRQTYDWQVRIFPASPDSAFTGQGDARSGVDPASGELWLPNHWSIDRGEVRHDPAFLAGTWSFDNGVLVAARSPLVSADQGALRYDPTTLDPIPPCALAVDTTATRTDSSGETVRITTTIAPADGSACEPFYANLSWGLLDADGWPVQFAGDTTIEPQLLVGSGDPATFMLDLSNWCAGGLGAPATVVLRAGPYGQHPAPLDVLPSCQDDREPLTLSRPTGP